MVTTTCSNPNGLGMVFMVGDCSYWFPKLVHFLFCRSARRHPSPRPGAAKPM